MNNIESMERLISALSMLPGVGKKTAERYAYSVINMSSDDVEFFAKAVLEAKKNVHYCKVCGNFTDKDICDICSTRTSDTICVVKEPKDIIAIEKSKGYNGLYHVLHGTLSPLEGRGPDDIHLKELVGRINNGGVREVIVATNPDVEGEVTASYIAKILKPLGIKVTRIAQGISMGSDIEYADEVTLSKAILDRKDI